MAESLLQELASLREQGLAQTDPARFRYIEALAAKIDGRSEALSQVLERKARAALETYLAQRPAPAASNEALPRASSPLQHLVAFLNGEESTDDRGFEAQLKQQELELLTAVGEELPEQATAPTGERPRELKSARRFRATLQQVGAERRLQQAGRETSEESGPLNPQKLVTESLRIMERLSPAYLERFIAYADTLLWLEQAAHKKSAE